MKKAILLSIILLVSGMAYSQTAPDTVIIETPKKQKIILIADDISSFRNLKTDSLIRVALRQIKDSISFPTKPSSELLKGLSRKERIDYYNRRNDSLQAIDGLTKRERTKKKLEELHSDKTLYARNLKNDGPIGIKLNLGTGLIRNHISPVIEAGLVFAPQRQDYYLLSSYPSYSFIALTANRYYSFEQTTTSTFGTSNNTFINASFGNRNNVRLDTNFLFSEFEIGLGYLIEREGNYFGRNTFKLFGSVVAKSKLIRVTPELFITDNFKEVFPGFTIKLF